MKVQEIEIDKIIIPEQRARATFTPEQEAELKASIEKNGFTIPILVRERGDGSYELIDGEHRIKIVKEMGWKKIPAVVLSADDKKATLLNILANTARGTQNPMDVAEALDRAYKAGATVEELSAATGHTASWVKLYLTLVALPDVYKQALRSGKLKVGHIQECGRLGSPEEIDSCLQSVLVHNWTVSVTKYYVDQRLVTLNELKAKGQDTSVSPPPTPEQAQQIVQYGECMFCHRKVPREKLTMPVMCEDCRTLLEWLIDQLGDPKTAMDTCYKALNMYYSWLEEQKRIAKQQAMFQPTQQQQMPTPQPVQQQAQTGNEQLSPEEVKLLKKLVKMLGGS